MNINSQRHRASPRVTANPQIDTHHFAIILLHTPCSKHTTHSVDVLHTFSQDYSRIRTFHQLLAMIADQMWLHSLQAGKDLQDLGRVIGNEVAYSKELVVFEALTGRK
jgi:hypothetical protein